jgi:hypothetical protein
VAGNTASICRRARALDNTISIAQGGASSLTGADAAVLTATASNNLLKAAYTVGFTGHRRGLPVVGTLVLLSGAAGLFGFLFQCPHDRRQGEHDSCSLQIGHRQQNSQVIIKPLAFGFSGVAQTSTVKLNSYNHCGVAYRSVSLEKCTLPRNGFTASSRAGRGCGRDKSEDPNQKEYAPMLRARR